VDYYDVGGFWAIGSGQTSALGTLFATQIPVIYRHLPDALYVLAKVKFNAESAMGVGKETTTIIFQSDGHRYLIHAPDMSKIKKIWESQRQPDIPNYGGDNVPSKLIEEAKKVNALLK
jgi:hypothetical protein